MATVQRFEDLLCWKKSRELTKDIYKTFAECKDRGFRDQIQRAAVSIISNISEGFESGTRDGFVNYLYIAKASSGEVRAQMYVAYDVGYLNVEIFKDLKNRAEECSRLIASFIKSVKSSPNTGLQRKREMSSDERKAVDFELHMKRELARSSPKLYGKGGSVADYSAL